MEHFVLLFVSSLSAEATGDAVIAIARQARANNLKTQITGLLVFDGENFAQLMEGPEAAVTTVAELMKSDHRHSDMEVLHAAPCAEGRRFPHWRLGYLVLDLQEFGLASLRGKRGPVALADFDFMLPALDLAVGDAMPGRLSRSRSK